MKAAWFKSLLVVALVVISGNRSWAQCASNQTFTVDPQPVAGAYAPGQVVSVCFNVGFYQQLGANWIHGFVFELGNGWNPASVVITQFPNTCSGSGNWGFYNSVTSLSNGQTFGPGVFYDYNNQFTPPDNDPGNNYGDQNVNISCQWYLCFNIAVATGCTNGDLSLAIKVTGDGTSGAWGNQTCAGVSVPVIENTVCGLACDYTVATDSTNPSCAGNNGTASLNISGGTPPFVYSWDNGGATASISNLAAGTYNVTVTDATGCEKTATVELTMTDSSGVAAAVQQEISCANYCDGQLMAVATFGVPPYAFTWSGGATGASASNLCSGTYTVTLVDGNQCSATATATLSNPPGLNVNVVTTNATCYGGANGTATVNVQSPQPVTGIVWSPAGQVTATIQNLPAGTYGVTVMNSNGCTIGASAVVSQPQPMLVGLTANDASCSGVNDASVMASAVQGTLPYSYVWSDGALGPVADNLAAGTYALTVTDANGCMADTFTSVNAPPALVLNFDAQPTSCEQASNGSVTADVYGGTPGYVYHWMLQPDTTNHLANVGAGVYRLTVTDANGCSAADSTHVVSEPWFNVDAGIDQEIVRGQTATLTALVDKPGDYAFAWLPAEDVQSSGIDYAVVKPDSTTVYLVVATDAFGCQSFDDVTVNVLSNAYIWVPNAFSPNGDGHNALFFPIPGDGTAIESFRVYTRWGKKVHDGNGLPGWNGNDMEENICPMSVYTYYCEYTRRDGVRSRKQGTVLLMR
ncbi:MAG TPA: gliding motility-associated C-terminal domain-containing protein [Chitinophagales bacterium]|nr:gliding motility-associated C-terminal domain-containing protein [Chitinophagales bacterium]